MPSSKKIRSVALFAVGVLSALTAGAQQKMPQWQIDAGGSAKFDVASVKLDKPDSNVASASNVPLGAMDAFSSTGGLFQATNQPFLQYLVFAYKLTSNQTRSVFNQFPKWADNNRYDIEARVSGDPTKDQFRLMMQSLLADRFKLMVHYETKQQAVLGLVLVKPEKMGSKLRLHPAGAPCSTEPARGATPSQTDSFPVQCGEILPLAPSAPGRLRFGARSVSMAALATFFSAPNATGLSDPLIDKTGIIDTVDFSLEWAPELRPGIDFQRDPNGPTFLEALKDQLGLKLVPQVGPVDNVVLDHLEEPSPN